MHQIQSELHPRLPPLLKMENSEKGQSIYMLTLREWQFGDL
jgi:hypothetical protein